LGISYAQVALYQKCGGEGYNGPRNCVSGAYCKVVNQWHHQCEPGSGGGSAPSPSPSPSPSPVGPPPPMKAGFPGKQFKHGIAFDGSISDDIYRQHDYISIWINTIDNNKSTDFNPWYQGDMIKKCKQLGKMPLFYAYIIAFEARAKKGIQDCDVDPNYNLCHKGAQFIKENRALLVSRYTHQAKAIASALGDKNAECVFVMEPDFWQFYGDKTQEGGTLDGPYMRKLFDDFAAAIKAELPNAKISWDISAWIGEAGMTQWWSFFKDSKYIDFVNTSGGQAHGETASIKPNELNWATVSKITGKRIIADCGYGVAGGASSNCNVWNLNNKNARVRDGVVALSAGVGAKNSPPADLTRVNLP